MKKKITAIIMTSLLLVTLGGATVLAAGNSRQKDQWQEKQGQDGSQGYAGPVTGTCTGVLSGTLDHCIYSHYNGYSSDIENVSYSDCRDGSTCICGGSHTFTDQDGDGVCDYRNSADGYQGVTGQYHTDGNCDGSGQYGHTGTMQTSGITAQVQADITENITVDKHAAVIFFRTSRKQGEGQRHAERGRKMFSAAGPFPWTL